MPPNVEELGRQVCQIYIPFCLCWTEVGSDFAAVQLPSAGVVRRVLFSLYAMLFLLFFLTGHLSLSCLPDLLLDLWINEKKTGQMLCPWALKAASCLFHLSIVSPDFSLLP